jgi:AcrR family transcriptional regulator
MTIIATTTVYSAECALGALETAYCDVEAKRAMRLVLPTSPSEVDALSDVAHRLKARLIESFASLAAQPTDPWTRFEQLMRAADLFGHDAPVVGLIAGALSADQARCLEVEAV